LGGVQEAIEISYDLHYRSASAMGRTAVNGVSDSKIYDTKSGEKRSFDSSTTTTAQSAKRPKLQERTDYSRWRMLDEKGRQTWHYLEDDEDAQEWPQSTADKYFLGLPTVCKITSSLTAAQKINCRVESAGSS
jgi:hypothetical protein